MALSYFINRKKATCVITFTGSITANDAEQLDLCLSETNLEPARHVILNLGGLKSVETDAYRALTLFQQGIRARSKLYLCDLLPEPAKVLKTAGVVRDSEIFADLMTALQAILNSEKG